MCDEFADKSADSNNMAPLTMAELQKVSKIVKENVKERIFTKSEINMINRGYAYAQNMFDETRMKMSALSKQTTPVDPSYRAQLSRTCNDWNSYRHKLKLLANKLKMEEILLTSDTIQQNQDNASSISTTTDLENDDTSNENQSSRVRKRKTSITKIPPKIARLTDVSKIDKETLTDPGCIQLEPPEVLGPDVGFFSNPRLNWQIHMDLKSINQVAAECIVLLANKGYHVTWDKVLRLFCQKLKITDLAHIGVRRASDIPAIDNLNRINDRIGMFMSAYSFIYPMGTLSDVDKSIASLFNRECFDDLCIGPLTRHPMVRHVFKIPDALGTSIPQINTSDLLSFLQRFINENDLWHKKVEVNEFVDFLKQKLHMNSPFELGIRIKGFGPAVSAIKFVQRSRNQLYEHSRNKLRKELLGMCKEEMERLTTDIREKLSSHTDRNEHSLNWLMFKQRLRYIELPASAVVVDIIESCRLLFEQSPFYEKVRDFLYQIQKDKLLRNLFQLAISTGRLILPDDVMSSDLKDRLNQKILRYPTSLSSSSDSSDEWTSVSDSILIETIRDYIKDHCDLNFNILLSAEQHVLDTFNQSSFNDLNESKLSFLQFIEQNHIIQQWKHPCHLPENVLDALSQIQTIDQWSESSINRSLQYYFEITDQATCKLLIKRAKDRKPCTYLISPVGLLGENEPTVASLVYGDVSLVDAAINRIQKCPLLFDLNQFCHWKLLFESKLGSLRSFIKSNTIEHVAVYDDPLTNTLLRLSSDEEQLNIENITHLGNEAISNNTSHKFIGVLISFLLVKHRSKLDQMPFALLGSVVHSILVRWSEKANLFVLDCLSQIPDCLLVDFAMPLFLQPLYRIQGSTSLTRQQLMKNANSKCKLMLERLGFAYGLMDLTSNFENPSLDGLSSSINHSNIDCSSNKPNLKSETVSSTAEIVNRVSDHQSSLAPSVNVTNATEHVESLRKNRFGIGLNLSDDGLKLADSLRNLIGRSLDRLSTELYSCDMHFVLELIQNADDNRYDPTTVSKIRFELRSNEIRVYNNEKGFTSEDIDAICDVGKSTKSMHRSGYIGHKGIGFKSVFAVSNKPEIHSGNYHIGFNVENGNSVGYILPHIVKELSSQYDCNQWTTMISLPLKSQTERERHKARSLTASFQDIRPTLLLFLNRLVEIQICSPDRSEQIFSKTNTPIEIADSRFKCSIVNLFIEHKSLTNKSESWLVIKQTINVPRTLNYQSNVFSTDIALALPICDRAIKIASEEIEGVFEAPSQDVFAYLPVRTYGLPFVVQADFELPSHRQDLKEDSEWNQWILLQIPEMFVNAVPKALLAFVNDAKVASRLFIHYIPCNQRTSGNIFQNVSNDIIRLLCREQIMMCVDHKTRIPSQCAFYQQSAKCLDEDVMNQLNIYYIDPIICKLTNENVLRTLGIQTIDIDHILDAIQLVETSSNVQLLQSLASIAPTLSVNKERELLNKLRSLKIIPLKNFPNDELVSIEKYSGLLFLPVSVDECQESWKRLVFDSLLVVDLERISNQENVKELLIKAGIRNMTPSEVYSEHVIQIFKTWNDAELLVASLIFTFDLWVKSSNNVDLNQLINVVKIKTSNGFFNPLAMNINFSVHYGNKYDLKKEFPGYDWSIIDECYCDIYSDVDFDKSAKWRTFLNQLGIVDLFNVKLVEHQLPVTQMKKKFEIDEKFQVNDVYVADFDCLMLAYLINSPDLNNMKALYKAIEEDWNNNFSKYKACNVYTLSGEHLLSLESTFYKRLKRCLWLPCSNPLDEDKPVYRNASNTFVRTVEMEKILSNRVPYLLTDVDSQSMFHQDLGLIQSISGLRLLDILIEWSREISSTNLTFDYTHLASVYDYLWRTVDAESLQNALLRNNLFYCKQKFVGRFYLYWEDPTNLFEEYIRMVETMENNEQTTRVHNEIFFLKSYYPENFKSFFVDIGCVSSIPSANEYLHLLNVIISLENKNCKTINYKSIIDVFRIFEQIGVQCKMALQKESQTNESFDVIKQNIKEMFAEKCMLPSIYNCWIRKSKYAILPDDQQLFEKFSVAIDQAYSRQSASDKPHFIYIPSASSSKGSHLLQTLSYNQQFVLTELCGIVTLSETIETEVNAEGIKPYPYLQSFLNKFVPFLQRYMLKHFPTIYNKLNTQNNICNQLQKMRFFTVSQLKIVYKLKQNPYIRVDTIALSTIHKVDNHYHFYIECSHFEDQREILRTFTSLFGGEDARLNRQLCNFLMLLRDEFANIENFAQYQDFSLQLPDNHAFNWSIPEVSAQEIQQYDEQMDYPDPRRVQSFLQLSEVVQRPNMKKRSMNESNPSWPPSSNSSFSNSSRDVSTNHQHSNLSQSYPMHSNQQPQISQMHTSNQQQVFSQSHNFTQNDHLIEEIQMENISSTTPSDFITSNDSKLVGISGERLVYNHLMTKYKDYINDGSMTVQWMNSESETGAPYDIVIKSPQGYQYIEVKSTTSSDKSTFPISIQQLRIASDLPDGFFIYRVYNVNRGQTKLRIISNVMHKLEAKAAQLWISL